MSTWQTPSHTVDSLQVKRMLMTPRLLLILVQCWSFSLDNSLDVEAGIWQIDLWIREMPEEIAPVSLSVMDTICRDPNKRITDNKHDPQQILTRKKRKETCRNQEASFKAFFSIGDKFRNPKPRWRWSHGVDVESETGKMWSMRNRPTDKVSVEPLKKGNGRHTKWLVLPMVTRTL